ncbi:hypothetical protein [Flavobacterium facile]|uniref:hypothetical protein n=1 Tax=Flavobacterium facile TaxID=2893174 RepID=UPI002E77B58C|nr:hypothetical protein [Flavobacterium sp. T-12]
MKKAFSVFGLLFIITGFLIGIISDFKKNDTDVRPLVFSAFVCFLVGIFLMIKSKNQDE